MKKKTESISGDIFLVAKQQNNEKQQNGPLRNRIERKKKTVFLVLCWSVDNINGVIISNHQERENKKNVMSEFIYFGQSINLKTVFYLIENKFLLMKCKCWLENGSPKQLKKKKKNL